MAQRHVDRIHNCCWVSLFHHFSLISYMETHVPPTSIILAFAGIHIYFATQLALPFVVYYVCGLLIPLFFLITSILLIRENNNNWIRSKYHNFRKNRSLKRQDVDEAVSHQVQNGDSSSKGNNVVTQPEQQVEVPDAPNNPYTTKVSLHIHHWQIFYVLAFFTRQVILFHMLLYTVY